MKLKKILWLALSSLLIACSHTPPSNTIPQQLISSSHPYANSRLTHSETAGPICPYRSFVFCTDYAHHSLLTHYPHLFKTTKDALSIRLYDGSEKTYLHQAVNDNCLDCRYKIIEDYPQIHSVLIFQATIGTPNLRLLNLKHATEIPLTNIPVFSPDFNYMVDATHIDQAKATLKIYPLTTQQSTPVFESALVPNAIAETGKSFQEVKWLDSQTLIVHVQQFNLEHEAQEFYFMLQQRNATPSNWHISNLTEDEYQQLKN